MSDTGLPVEEEDRAVALASLPQRLGGVLVDGLLTSMVIVVPLLFGVMRFADVQQLRIPPGWAAALLVFAAVYTIVPTALFGQTAGKLAVGTRVVVDDEGGVPGWRRSVVRWLVSEGLGQLPVLGLVVSLVVVGSILMDPRRRGLHDKAAGTVVVRA